MTRQSWVKKLISKARFAGKIYFFDRLRGCILQPLFLWIVFHRQRPCAFDSREYMKLCHPGAVAECHRHACPAPAEILPGYPADRLTDRRNIPCPEEILPIAGQGYFQLQPVPHSHPEAPRQGFDEGAVRRRAYFHRRDKPIKQPQESPGGNRESLAEAPCFALLAGIQYAGREHLTCRRRIQPPHFSLHDHSP